MRARRVALLLILISAVPAPPSQAPDGHQENKDQAAWMELGKSMKRMHVEMSSVGRSGDADVDFVQLMLPHHQAAIDMAKTEMLRGKDPQVRRLAQEIITDQQSEVELMQLWLKQRAGNPEKANSPRSPQTGEER